MVANVKIDHDVISAVLDDMAGAPHDDARKQLVILKQLLINHFFIEDFVLYPYIRERYVTKRAINRASLFDVYEVDDAHQDMLKLTDSVAGYHSVGAQMIQLLTECTNAEEPVFFERFGLFRDRLKTRIAFENAILETRVSSRVAVELQVALRIVGASYVGTMRTVNERGCAVEFDRELSGVSPGDTGALTLFSAYVSQDLPCKVLRLSAGEVAIQFLADLPAPLKRTFYPPHATS